ncbi:unnamed protein product [Adineta ricciae]|uniref:Uncharacterized protein n=1 Tax=Adineta ricciae TaxID=249248 RepID=A0A815VGD6_ADIRI|nr:unnamed protein product [Adineta ricciae]
MGKMSYATCSILILFSLYFAQTINGQTCQGKSQYDSCSSNSACGCLPLSISDDVSICAVLGVSCSRLQTCQSPGDACERADHVCVRHPRCNSLTPVCYPLTMIDQRLCPPSPSTPTPSFTTTPGFPLWNTTAYPFYNSTSYPYYNSTSYPFWNTTAYPFYNSSSYPFYNSTSYPFWNTTAYPFYNSSSYPFYNSTSYPFYNSSSYPFWNTTAYPFYNSTSYPFYNSSSYPFWNTTAYPFYNSTSYPFYNSSSYPFHNSTANSLYNGTVPTSTNGYAPASVHSYYTNALTIYSGVYPGTVNKYYQAISVAVKTPGLYTFTSMSYMNTAAVLYKDGINFYYPTWNLVSSVNTFDSNQQFKLSHKLDAGTTYILVVTTIYHGQMGPFTVTASGPDYVQFY